MTNIYHTLVMGETLQSLAMKHYGSPHMAHRIFLANQNVLKNPEGIMAGKRIIIPDGRVLDNDDSASG